jgi:hypothetical protein
LSRVPLAFDGGGEDRTKRLADDVFHDVVGGVVDAGPLPLAPLVDDVDPPVARLPDRREVVFEQPFVDGP